MAFGLLAVLSPATTIMMAASVPSPSIQALSPIPLVPWARVDRFLGQFTHDIRNGLNALELQVTLLAELSADPEVMVEVKALRRTLVDLTRQLQAVKTLAGPVSPQLLCYPAADFFEDLRERFQRLQPAATKQIAWDIAVDGSSLTIDPELTLSALLELVNNALYFGGPGAIIGLLAQTQADGSVLVTLREAQPQPPAVSPEEWGRTPLLSTRRDAYGLGLFRVRRILEAQGGTLDAGFSTADHVLATFVVLPAAATRSAV